MKKLLIITSVCLLFLVCGTSEAGRWDFRIGTGGVGFGYHGSNTHFHIGTPYWHPGPYRYHYRPYRHSYYPRYYNPVERRDVHHRGHVAPNGTYHSESVTEDRHSSYYSPGRNDAITRPRREVWHRPNGQTIDRTEWIGADGQPHSTTIRSRTYQDGYGDTHTDTHVELKNNGSSEPSKPLQLMPKKEKKDKKK